jgi:hypothetical protein
MVRGEASFPSLLGGGGVLSKTFQELFAKWSSRADLFLSRDAVHEYSPNHLCPKLPTRTVTDAAARQVILERRFASSCMRHYVVGVPVSTQWPTAHMTSATSFRANPSTFRRIWRTRSCLFHFARRVRGILVSQISLVDCCVKWEGEEAAGPPRTVKWILPPLSSRSSNVRRRSLLNEVVFVKFPEFHKASLRDSNPEFEHQLGQLSAINEYNCCLKTCGI